MYSFCARRDPESVRTQSSHQFLFTLLGSTSLKAVRRTLMKSTPDHFVLIQIQDQFSALELIRLLSQAKPFHHLLQKFPSRLKFHCFCNQINLIKLKRLQSLFLGSFELPTVVKLFKKTSLLKHSLCEFFRYLKHTFIPLMISWRHSQIDTLLAKKC
jgi:hypothetical protein